MENLKQHTMYEFTHNPNQMTTFIYDKPNKRINGEKESYPVSDELDAKWEDKRVVHLGKDFEIQKDWKEHTKILMESLGDNPKDFKYEPTAVPLPSAPAEQQQEELWKEVERLVNSYRKETGAPIALILEALWQSSFTKDRTVIIGFINRYGRKF
jgi:hypothetical protein